VGIEADEVVVLVEREEKKQKGNTIKPDQEYEYNARKGCERSFFFTLFRRIVASQ
jgi:hypothetical protein